ncbi:hypothetical protein HK101_002732 [Irineochytrium annulatum]|nr:hypothetical protein HK101_002732 [Irineochytrium annulatum]
MPRVLSGSVVVIGATVLAAMSAVSAQTAAQTAACGGLLNNNQTAFKASAVLACYASFPVTQQNVSDYISALKYYLPLSSNLDLVKSMNGVDLAASLDAVAADTTIANEFEMHSKIFAAVQSVPANFGYFYFSSCFENFYFFQPWTFNVIYNATTGPTVYLGKTIADVRIEEKSPMGYAALKSAFAAALGYDPTIYTGYQIDTINGQPAMTFYDNLDKRSSYPSIVAVNGLATTYQWMNGAVLINNGYGSSSPQIYDGYFQHDVTYGLKGPQGDSPTITVSWQALYNGPQVPFSAFWTNNCIVKDPRPPHPSVTIVVTATVVTQTPAATAAVAVEVAAPARRRRDNPARPVLTRRQLDLNAPLYQDKNNNAFYMVSPTVGVWQVYLSDANTISSQGSGAWPAMFDSIDKGLRQLAAAGAKTVILDVTAGTWMPCAGAMMSKYFFGSNATITSLVYDVPLPSAFMDNFQSGRDKPGPFDVTTMPTFLFGSKGYKFVDGSASIVANPVTVRGATRSPRFTISCDNVASIDALSSPFAPSSIAILSAGGCTSGCAEFALNAQQLKVATYTFGSDGTSSVGTASQKTYPLGYFTPPLVTDPASIWREMHDQNPLTTAPFIPYPAYFDFPVVSSYLPTQPVGDASYPLEFDSSSLANAGTYLPAANGSDIVSIWRLTASAITGVNITDPSTGGGGSANSTAAGSSSSSSTVIIVAVVCAVVGLILGILLIVFLLRRNRKQSDMKKSQIAGGVVPSPTVYFDQPAASKTLADVHTHELPTFNEKAQQQYAIPSDMQQQYAPYSHSTATPSSSSMQLHEQPYAYPPRFFGPGPLSSSASSSSPVPGAAPASSHGSHGVIVFGSKQEEAAAAAAAAAAGASGVNVSVMPTDKASEFAQGVRSGKEKQLYAGGGGSGVVGGTVEEMLDGTQDRPYVNQPAPPQYNSSLMYQGDAV